MTTTLFQPEKEIKRRKRDGKCAASPLATEGSNFTWERVFFSQVGRAKILTRKCEWDFRVWTTVFSRGVFSKTQPSCS